MKYKGYYVPILVVMIVALFKIGTSSAQTAPASVYDFTMKGINGKDVPLQQFAGKVVMIVNVASKCGLTPQYDDLEVLFKKFGEQGFVVLGFPANNFANQEPGTNEEIHQFCRTTYGVTFPMFSKISVKGDDQDALYKYLTGASGKFKGDIQWNFTKFLIGRNGDIVARFEPKIKPTDPAVIAAIESALGKK